MEDLAQSLKQFRLKIGLSQSEIAKKLQIPQTTWSGYERGRSNPTVGVVIGLEKLGFKYKKTALGAMQGYEIPYLADNDIKDGFVIPILEQSLSAGKGQPLPDSDVYRGYIEVPGELKRYGKNLAALQVNGDSMEPTLKRGDLVICDSCGWDGEGVYVIHMDGCGYVKGSRISRARLLL